MKFDSSSSLSGKFVSYTGTSSLMSVAGMTCAAPTAALYKLDEDGNKIEPVLATTQLAADGSYVFKTQALGIPFKNKIPAIPLIVAVNGCSDGPYLRPITGSKDQNITMGSAVLSYILNTGSKQKLVDVLNDSPAELEALLAGLSHFATAQEAYDYLEGNTALKNKFNDLFSNDPIILIEASPEINSFVIPATAQELQAVNFKATTSHWSNNYNINYTWKLDNTVIGHTGNLVWTPTANKQGSHILTLIVGEDDGAGNVDSAKPTKVVSKTIVIENTILPTAPGIVITTPIVTGGVPINTRTLTVAIDTGNGRINCESFSSLALVEHTGIPADAAFTLLCSTAGTQNVNLTLTSAGDGPKTLRLWAKDASGTISSVPEIINFNLDTGIPVATLNLVTALSNSNSQNFTFSGNDNGGTIDHFECKLDAGAYSSCSSPKTYSSLIEGDHTFSVKAVDTAGNQSVVESQTWHIDLTAPVLSVSGTPSAVTNQLSSFFTFSATDTGGAGVSIYQCNVDSAGYSTCISPYMSALTAGTHNVAIRALDSAGNISNVSNYSWTIDTTPPTATITSKPSSLTNAVNATFSFTGADTGGGSVSSFECQIDGGGYSACTTPKAYISLAATSHTFNVRAIDSAGNTGVAQNYTWSIDTSTPLASINSGPDSITNSTAASFTFSANPPPAGSITGYECNHNSAGWVSCSSPQNYSSLTQMEHTFEVRSVDNNGNRSSAVSQTWIVDLTVPTVAIGTKPATPTSATSAVFTFTGADTGGGAIDGYECKLDTGSYAACSSPANYSAMVGGSHTFSVKAHDTAGNNSVVSSYTWIVDLTAPVATIDSNPNSITNSLSATFTFSATDVGGTVSSFECSIDSGAYSTCTSTKIYTGLAVGSHNFSVKAIDSSGNISTAVSYNWTIDTSAPVIGITTTPNAITNATAGSFSFLATDSGGSSIANYNCKLDSGSYSTCTSPASYTSLASGSHTFSVTATDTAGNTSIADSFTWTIDTTPPTVAITTPSTNGGIVPAGQVTSYSVGGTCSEHGLSVTLSGPSTQSVTCNSGSWSTTISLSGSADGTLSLVVSQTDVAGNTTASTARTFIKDTTLPVINVTTPVATRGNGAYGNASWSLTEANVATSTNFTVEFYNGSTWSTVGTKAATAGANSNQSYSLANFSVPNVSTVAAKIRVTLTDAAGNSTTTTSASYIVDSAGPSLTSFAINNGSASSNVANIPFTFQATDNLTNITKLCLKSSSAAPVSSDACWSLVSSYGATPSANLTLSSYYNLGYTNGAFTIYIWTMDALGNISSNTSVESTDKGQAITYTQPLPPSISQVQLSSSDNPTLPLAGSDLTAPISTSVYLKWNVSSNVGLATNPITIEYDVSGVYTTISGGADLTNAGNGGCTVTAGFTGCAVFSAPTANYFKLRVKAKDSVGGIATSTSNAMNTLPVNFLAGNTDLGLGGSAKSVVLRPSTDRGLAVLNDGRVFVADSRGLGWVNPTTGTYEILIKSTGSTTGNGVNVSSATFTALTGVYVDYQSNLIVTDNTSTNNYIMRKINTQTNPMTISNFIGGGTDVTTNTFTSLTAIRLQSSPYLYLNQNGDIWFKSDGDNHKIRVYSKANNNITTLYLTGYGNSLSPTQDNTLCLFGGFFVTYDSDKNVDHLVWKLTSIPSGTNCNYSNGYTGYAAVDPTTGVSFTPSPTPINMPLTGYSEIYNYYTAPSGEAYGFGTGFNTSKAGIFKFNKTTLAWDSVAGTGAAGTCDDNTLAASCAIAPQAMSINSAGQIFYVDSFAKTVRTIDSGGRVQTLLGDKLGADDGKNVLLARFASLTSVKRWSNSGVETFNLMDFANSRIREFTEGGNISTIAGNQVSAAPDTVNLAKIQSIMTTENTNATAMIVNESTGDIYYPRTRRFLSRLNRSTGKWVDIKSGYDFGPMPLGIYSGRLIYGTFTYCSGLASACNSKIEKLTLSTGITAGIINYGSNIITQNLFCANGIALSACNPVGTVALAAGAPAKYDAVTSQWLMGEWDTSGRIVKFNEDGTGTLGTLAQMPRNIRGFDIKRSADLTTNMIYYCSSAGLLYKYNLNTSAETYLPLPSTSMTCTGLVDYSPTRNSLIFIYSHNGLTAAAEYLNP